MDLKEIVANYATKKNETVNVDLKGLSADDNFRSLVTDVVINELKKKPQACVFIPAYRRNSHLGTLINELAVKVQMRTLVTGDVQNLQRLRSIYTKDVILVKQSFRAGKQLAEQVQTIKNMGGRVTVICIVAHSKEKLEQFAAENNVEVKTLVNLDEL